MPNFDALKAAVGALDALMAEYNDGDMLSFDDGFKAEQLTNAVLAAARACVDAEASDNNLPPDYDWIRAEMPRHVDWVKTHEWKHPDGRSIYCPTPTWPSGVQMRKDRKTSSAATRGQVRRFIATGLLPCEVHARVDAGDADAALFKALGFEGERLAALRTMASLGELKWGPRSHKDDNDEFYLCEYEDGPYIDKSRNNPKYYLAIAVGDGGPYFNVKLIIDPRGPRRETREYPNTVDGITAAFKAAIGGK